MSMHAASYRDYLQVERYLADMVGARALSSGFELGVIDALLGQPQSRLELQQGLQRDARGLALLLGMLAANGVVVEQDGQWRLAAEFRTALAYRDLMVEKLGFAHLVAPDFTELFSVLLAEPQRFFERARLFALFSYQRCFEATPENVAATQRWMRITTALTKYEAAACIAHYDFARHRRQLDVGGNSGEFALRVCRQHPQLRATVYDLPVVCGIGEKHVAQAPEGARIGFARAPRDQVQLPGGHDLISFKSMLHDWPDAEMLGFLAAAHAALEPGGRVLIFERGPLETGPGRVPYATLPFLLFFRSYRSAETYCGHLEKLGFRDIQTQVVELDMPFILISAAKHEHP